MRISQRLMMLVGGLLATNVVTLGVGSVMVSNTHRSYATTLDRALSEMDTAMRIKDAYQAQAVAWDEAVLHTGDPAAERTAQQELRTATQQVDAAVAQAQQIRSSQVRSAVNSFAGVHRDLSRQQRQSLPQLTRKTYRGNQALNAQARTASGLATRPLRQAKDAARQAMRDEDAASRRALVLANLAMGSLLLLMTLAAGFLARSIVGPLRRMIDAAHDTAKNRLPHAVTQIRGMENEVIEPALPPFETTGRDELSHLAAALNQLQGSALGLAAAGRRSELAHAKTLVNLGRRNQTMLNRTLTYVSELQKHEEDPQNLSRLYQLDHLTTRIRRNAESMLVLAGAEQSRPHSRPVVMENVLRAALAEIEDYPRVQIQQLAPVSIVGHAAADLSHLLAELLENAASFSPTTSEVEVTGSTLSDGYEIRITDHGLGIPPAELEAANRQLAGESDGISDTRRLGHLIVSRIAARRSIQVRLQSAQDRGTTAVVTIPGRLIHSYSRETGTPAMGIPRVTAALARGQADLASRGSSDPPLTPGASSTVDSAGGVPAAEPARAGAVAMADRAAADGRLSAQAPASSAGVGGLPVQQAAENHAQKDPVPESGATASDDAASGEADAASDEDGTESAQTSGVPRRRVRGARLHELDINAMGSVVPLADPGATRSALSGLQRGQQQAREQMEQRAVELQAASTAGPHAQTSDGTQEEAGVRSRLAALQTTLLRTRRATAGQDGVNTEHHEQD